MASPFVEDWTAKDVTLRRRHFFLWTRASVAIAVGLYIAVTHVPKRGLLTEGHVTMPMSEHAIQRPLNSDTKLSSSWAKQASPRVTESRPTRKLDVRLCLWI